MTRPSLSREQVLALPGVADLVAMGPVIVGIRGFFDEPNHNQRGVYDDAAFMLGSDTDDFRAFNWNTDPSLSRDNMAVLQPGTYKWKKGIHGMHHLNLSKNKDGLYLAPKDKSAYDWLLAHVGQDHPDPAYRLTYWAYRQASPMTVLRDGKKEPETVVDPAGWPMIDGHHGGLNGTSSEGCQTNPIEQWQECRAFGYGLMDKHKTDRIFYHLIVKS
jgi:hypothetical protein